MTQWEERILRDREATRVDELREILSVDCRYLSGPLYLLFWIADLIYAPQLKWEFLILRSIILPISLTTLILSKKLVKPLHLEWVATSFVILSAFPITLMCYVTDGIGSPYYAGLNLVTMGTIGFFPMRIRFLAIATVMTYLPYFFIGFLQADKIGWPNIFWINCFFIAGTLSISIVIRYFGERTKVKEVANRMRLEDEVQNREQLIYQKTQEALQLANLSNQFSPQVVQAIKSGNLDLNSEVHRAKICAIFIDIVNSTARVVRIDKDDVKKVIALFMEDTMRILLKYDITIDKFLGDGVLAFSNDPMKHDDYVERVIKAALDIRKRIADRQEEYEDLWLNEFQIRVGIATGFADVGFYGSSKNFRSYTAIGPVINLASRLCGAAEPNDILISNDVAKIIDDDEFDINLFGKLELKGFEGDIIKSFTVNEHKGSSISSGVVHDCPECNTVLHLDTDNSGIFVFKCRSCGFVLDPEKTKIPDAA